MDFPRHVRFTPITTELRTSPEVRFVPNPEVACLYSITQAALAS